MWFNEQDKDEIDIMGLLIDLSWLGNVKDEVDIGTMETVIEQTHNDDGIESLEQIAEFLLSGEQLNEEFHWT